MKAREILEVKGSRVITIHKDNLMTDVMALFFSNKIGSVIVVDNHDRILGIVAPNDVLRAVYENIERAPRLKVADIMTREVIVATPDDDTDYLLAIMTENRIRHIPILEKGNLVGLVSIGDVVRGPDAPAGCRKPLSQGLHRRQISRLNLPFRQAASFSDYVASSAHDQCKGSGLPEAACLSSACVTDQAVARHFSPQFRVKHARCALNPAAGAASGPIF